MYKRIMVAIDDSSTSNKALNEAAQLATSVGAALCIVHAEDESLLEHSAISTGTLIDVGEVEAEIRAGGMQLLNGAAAHVAQHGITAEKRLIESSSKRVPEMITECARDWGGRSRHRWHTWPSRHGAVAGRQCRGKSSCASPIPR